MTVGWGFSSVEACWGCILAPQDFSHRGQKRVGNGLHNRAIHSLLPCLALMLWFISCSYRVYLGMEPED